MNKSRILLLAAVFYLCGSPAFAQSSGFYSEPYSSRNSGSFDQDRSILTLGYGFPNLSGTGYYWYGNRLGIGPVYLKYEQAVRAEVGVGGYAALATSRYKYSSGDVSRSIAISAAALAYYHFNKFIPLERLDVYGGVGLGFRVQHYANAFTDDDLSDTDVFPVFKVGARWYFSDAFSVYVESGYDRMSSINLGLSLSL